MRRNDFLLPSVEKKGRQIEPSVFIADFQRPTNRQTLFLFFWTKKKCLPLFGVDELQLTLKPSKTDDDVNRVTSQPTRGFPPVAFLWHLSPKRDLEPDRALTHDRVEAEEEEKELAKRVSVLMQQTPRLQGWTNPINDVIKQSSKFSAVLPWWDLPSSGHPEELTNIPEYLDQKITWNRVLVSQSTHQPGSGVVCFDLFHFPTKLLLSFALFTFDKNFQFTF